MEQVSFLAMICDFAEYLIPILSLELSCEKLNSFPKVLQDNL